MTDPVGGKLDELIARKESELADRQPGSIAFADRARRVLAGGVACSWHMLDPHTMYGSRGAGSHIVDLDGNDFVDMHCGFGVMVAGHANPKVVEAVRRRVAEGTHFALPVEDTVAVAEHLAERFELPLWRFVNSGSEATSDAVRIARATTGRDLIIRVEGCYHGSPDGLDFSGWPDVGAGWPEVGPAGTREHPNPVPQTVGIPPLYGEALRLVSMNDLGAIERILAEEGDRVAAMILEPIPLNMGVVVPVDGYLEAVRELTRRHGVLLVFDEVKTGATIAYGGAIERFGVMPDLITLAKAIGGGLPIGAVGGTDEAMAVVADGTMEHEGTFNGNPLSMAAAKATLTEVLTKDVYPHFDVLNRVILEAVDEARSRAGVPLRAEVFGARGGLQFSDEPLRDFRDRAAIDWRLVYLEYLFQMTGGVFEPNGDPLTTSVAHTTEDVGRWAGNLVAFADAIVA
jgi:glutamate-1-semialdehyde 2,1-aminomutase